MKRLIWGCITITFFIAMSAIIGWLFNLRLPSTFGPAHFIPMAHSTALLFILLSAALFIYLHYPQRIKSNLFIGLIAAFIFSLSAIILLHFFGLLKIDIEQLFFKNPELLDLVPIGRMSPITAANFLVLSLALLLISSHRERHFSRQFSAIFSVIAFACGIIIVIGYLYRQPFLYGKAIIPVALSTGIAFISISLGAIASCGKDCWPINMFCGESISARLIRAFIPAVLFTVVFDGWIDSMIFIESFPYNRALVHTISFFFLIFVLWYVIIRVSRVIGSRIGTAESERKRAEEALRKINEFNTELLKTIPLGMNIVDESGTILYMNESFKKVIGYDAIGRKCWEVYKDNKEQCDHCPLKTRVTVGETTVFETRGILGGKVYRISHTGMIFEGRKSILEIFEDYTAQKESDNKLMEMVALKSEFVSMISHELRTPLTAIKEGIAIVRDQSAGSINLQQQEFLDIADRNAKRLGRLINNVLDFQKIESGRMDFLLKPGDINTAVNEAKDELYIQAKEKGLDFMLELKSGLPQVNFDKDKIIQVLANLVSNAIKFTEKGSIKIKTEETDGAIKVSVSDTGVGIKQEDIPRLFQEFSQLYRGKERKMGSTGLGLAIAKKIIMHHGGQIWVESEFGKGSAFYFVLPAR